MRLHAHLSAYRQCARPVCVRPARGAAATVSRARPLVLRATEGNGPTSSKVATEVGGAAEEVPQWEVNEKRREAQAAAGGKALPWPLYLLGSVLVAIAAVGSVFEFVDRHAVFGVIPPENVLWAPILGFFALSGLPVAGYLFFKCVQLANEAAEEQDRLDGYR